MTSTLMLSLTADTAALERIENALLQAKQWRELQQVTAQHVHWNGSAAASLMLFQANEALGLRDQAADALAKTISQLELSPDEDLLARSAQAAKRHCKWDALAQLRDLQWNVHPNSPAARFRWLESLRLAARSDAAMQAVNHAWKRRERDPLVLARLAQWLISSSNWAALAALRTLQWNAEPTSGAMRLRWLDALMRAARGEHPEIAVSLAWHQRGLDPSVLPRLSHWLIRNSRWTSLARLRSLQLQNEPDSKRARLLFLEALRRASQGEDSIEAVKLAWEQANQDRSMLARLAQWLIKAGRWPALALLRSLQWNAEPDSAAARLRFLEALRLAVQGDASQQAVPIAWKQCSRDPALLKRFSHWMTKYERWSALADLRYMQAESSTRAGPYLISCLELLHRAGELSHEAPAFKRALALAEQSPAFLRILRDKVLQWQCLPLLSDIRIMQLASGSVSFALAGMHVRTLKQQGLEHEVSRFLQKLARQKDLQPADAASLRRLLLRERQLDSLEQRLHGDHRAAPENIEIMLETATLHELRRNFDQRASWIKKVHAQLMAEPHSSAGDKKEVTVTPIRTYAECGLLPLVQFPVTVTSPPALLPLIEHLATTTQRLGTFEIWSGYEATDIKTDSRIRVPNDIRVGQRVATFLAHLARGLRPRLIVEIGTGFGVSGMYWASALAEAGTGSLITFEPNSRWRAIAEHNIRTICDRVQLIEGTFEDQLAPLNLPPQSIDILSVDAIHTVTAVSAQLKLAATLLAPGAVILIDDIKFSPGMYKYWRRLAAAPEFRTSFEIESRMGVLVRNS